MDDVVLNLVKLIAKLIKEGLSPEEVARRIEDPTGVGADLIKRAAERQDLGKDYLGR